MTTEPAGGTKPAGIKTSTFRKSLEKYLKNLKEIDMYKYTDKTDGTQLSVALDRGTNEVVVSLAYLGSLSFIALDAQEAVKFAEAVLKVAGSDSLVVPLAKDEVSVDRYGSISCGQGAAKMKVAKDVPLENVRKVLSNLAKIVVWMEKAQEVDDQVSKDRKEVAALLGIDVPEDLEGLKALDEMVKRRKGVFVI